MSITNVITKITVDMAGDVKRFAVKAKQYDRATRVIVVSLLWDEVPYVLDSADTVRCNVHKPDGTIAIIEGDNIAVSGNTVTITLPGSALTAAGRAWADIEIETQDESQQVSCQCFEIDIAKSPVDDDSIISTNEFSAMKLATKAANDAAAAATAEIEATAAAGRAASQAAEAAQAATDAANQAAEAATASIQIDTTLTDNTKAAPAGMVGQIKEDLSAFQTATTDDVGKALKVKTVTDGKVTEWEFGEAGGDAELKDRVDSIENLTIDVTESTADMTLLEKLSKKLIDTDGTIIDGTVNNQYIHAYIIPSGATDTTIKAADRVSGEAIYAVYASTTISGCDSTTLIERAKYVSQAEKNIKVPSTARLVLIQGNAVYIHTANITTAESKSAKMIADAYSATKVYSVGDYCNYDGLVYKRIVYTGTIGDWNASEWELVAIANDVKDLIDSEKIATSFPAELFRIGRINGTGAFETDQKYRIAMPATYHNDETITYEIADGYTVTVWYYDENDTYLAHNDSATTFNARTILAGSHFRLGIRITGVSTNLQEWQIPILASAVTFQSAAGKKEDDIATGVTGAMDALEAQMYQRGASPKTFAKAPCIIVAGQSNIEGRVPVADLPSDIVFPFENIKVGNDNGTFSSSESAPTSKWDITTSMFSALNALGTPIYKIKTAQGDTSISEYGASNYHWTPFFEKISNPNYALLLKFDKKIKKCLESTANTFDIRAFVWQQGEGDRGKLSKRAALDYYKNFKCLVAYVRGVAGDEKLPVVCGTVSHNSSEYDATVEAATIGVAEEDPYMTCIDMSGATLLDSYHFDATNAVYFGQMAYDALIDFGVITGTKINPTRPW